MVDVGSHHHQNTQNNQNNENFEWLKGVIITSIPLFGSSDKILYGSGTFILPEYTHISAYTQTHTDTIDIEYVINDQSQKEDEEKP